MSKKFYFAGSIRGGRVDADLYRRMIARIKENGVVLTEHVGDLALSEKEQGLAGDSAIYQQDTSWLRQSDVLIGECTCPSLGVGYELAYAEAHEIPCFLFYNRSRCQLSAMLSGNPYFTVHSYETEAELFEKLDKVLSAL